jgi:hypothetical protein
LHFVGDEQDEVVVRKGNCGLPGLKIYVANWIAATQSLSSKFLGSLHLQSKNAAGKNVQKLKHIQDEFVSNLEVMKKFKERVHQYDMRTTLQVPAVYHDMILWVRMLGKPNGMPPTNIARL